ncbi:MAG: FAD-dependent oxidoreductase, partial [Patescibacteria group bacterium]|nr:FAD-dependent oxidoreductase [Patescibacteria group bacterium]
MPKQTYKYLIVGGGVAGTTAAETIRAKDPSGTVAIISDEPYPFYSRIMMSKPAFFLGKISFDSIWLKKPAWYQAQRIEFYSGLSAVALDAKAKLLTLSDGQALGYEKLLLALGARAAKLPGPDADKPGVFYLRSLEHARAIIAALQTSKKVVVLGGGFVGFETCELMRMAGLSVTLVMRERYFWDFLWDEESGRMLEDALTLSGVELAHSLQVLEVLGG